MDYPVMILKILVGILMLVAGQKCFWLFVGLLGFWGGSQAAVLFSFGLSEWQALMTGLACGLIGLGLAFFLQGVAMVVAGFLGGAYVFFNIWNIFRLGMNELWWPLLIISGVVGIVLLLVFFNPALVVITSLAGAMLIAESIPIPRNIKLVVLALLFIVGLMFQARYLL